MPTRPKSISLSELSSAVQEALKIVKIKPNPQTGPWPWINPILVGIVIKSPVAEARAIGETIAKQVSQRLDTPVTPIVEEAPAGAATAQLAPNHVLTGFKRENAIHF